MGATVWRLGLILSSFSAPVVAAGPPGDGVATFNVKGYGATGVKADDARPAIQKAIDSCAAAGGGVVYVPPGSYTSGTLHLRSNVRFHLEAGATLFAAPDPSAYDCGKIASKAAVLYGEDIENVSLEGRGTVDGQAEYEWRPDDVETHAFLHKKLMDTLGKSTMRSFPKGFPRREVFPHLVWIGKSKDVRIAGLKFLRSPSWSITLSSCERSAFDGLYIYTSLRDGVWADGIDLDGCRDVSISNCTIETGDDCIALVSEGIWSPAQACEDITVVNCRLSSASAGIKFTEGNRVAVRRVLVSNVVFRDVNRGVVFSITTGGKISDVILSDLIMNCRRYDWFWAGDGQPFYFRITRTSELNQEPPKPGEPGPGSIRGVTIRNVLAHAQGSSLIRGHPESPIDGLDFEDVKLWLTADPAAPYDQAEHALDFRWVRNLRLQGVEVTWEKPALPAWKSALCLEDVRGVRIFDFAGRAAWPEQEVPAISFRQVSDALIRHARAPEGTRVFLKVTGPASGDIRLQGNDLRKAEVPWRLDGGAPPDAVKALEDARTP